jgi:murein DD-endopeptidase MepM/ murein hydrolase activator NlpD
MKRNKFQKIVISVICVLLAVIMALSLVLTVIPANAVDETDLERLEEQRRQLEEELAEQEELIQSLSANQSLIVVRKAALDKQISLNREIIALVEEQMDAYQDLIDQKETELAEATAAETEQTALLRKRIRAMEENGSYSYLTFIFEGGSVTEILARIADVNDIMTYDRDLEQSLQQTRSDVETIKSEYEAAQAEQAAISKELTTRREQLDAQVEAACELIANLDELSTDAQAEYTAIENAENEAMQELLTAMQEYSAQQAAQAAQAAAAQQTYSAASASPTAAASTTTTTAESTTTTGGTYENNANASSAYNGTFIWPTDSTYVTSKYGLRDQPTAGASTNHKAIDIGAASGTPIYAAADGQVVTATYNNGLGYYVSIEHDSDTATRYSHMTNYIVQPGEYVTQGQIIGYVGESGIATGSHLDYAVIVDGEQVDPMQYYDSSAVTYDPTA